MTRHVDVFVTGIHVRAGEPAEKIESIVPGVYEILEDGTRLVEYDEDHGNGSGEMKVHNRVEIGAGLRNMKIKRNGATNSQLSFGQDMEYDTEYVTPYGSMQMKVRTNSFDCSLKNDEEIKVVAEYDLEVEGQVVSESMIVLDIKNAETG